MAEIPPATHIPLNKSSTITIIYDSQNTPQALNILDIVKFIRKDHDRPLVWIASRVGIPEHDHADHLARLTRDKHITNTDLGVLLSRVSHIIKTSCAEDLTELTNTQKPGSCGIKHRH